MMSKTVIPHGYKPLLDLYQTQTAIGCLKRNFEQKLCAALNLKRVSAPLFVEPSTGLNDDLNGVERPVSFDLKETGRTAQVVHSLAKWKRMALYKYGFTAGEGLYTDMNAIRRDEEMDNLHSVYVDQWDWEKVITPAERTTAYLQSTVRAIYAAVSGTLDELKRRRPAQRRLTVAYGGGALPVVEGLTPLRDADGHAELLLDTDLLSVSEAVARISAQTEVKDLSVSGESIEELVVSLYREYRI